MIFAICSMGCIVSCRREVQIWIRYRVLNGLFSTAFVCVKRVMNEWVNFGSAVHQLGYGTWCCKCPLGRLVVRSNLNGKFWNSQVVGGI